MESIPDITMSSWWLCKLDVGKPRDTALVDYLEFKLRLAIKRTIVCEPQAYLFEGPLLDKEKNSFILRNQNQYNIYILKVSVHESGWDIKTVTQINISSNKKPPPRQSSGRVLVSSAGGPGSIPTQGPRHMKNVIKMVPGSSLV